MPERSIGFGSRNKERLKLKIAEMRLRVGEEKLLARIGQFVSHTLNVAGDIDSSNKCTTGTLLYNGIKMTEQVASRILEVGLFEEAGIISDLSGRIWLQGGLYANVADRAIIDSIMGTYIWNLTKVECPDTLNRIYRGMMHFYVNSSTTASLDQGTQGQAWR